MQQQSSNQVLDTRALLDRAGLAPGMHVADLGCGVTGHIIVPAAQRVGDEGKAYAVDIQKSALAATESRAKLAGATNIVFVWSDLERAGATNIPAGSLDVAMLVSTLHLTAHRDAVCREAARLLKSGGVLLAVEWKPAARVIGPAAAQRVDADAIRAAAQAAGLIEQSAFDAGPYHYGLIFAKPS